MKIIPAILEKDFSEIKNKLELLAKIKKEKDLDFNLVQIDFCDGEFVENKTWLPDFVFGKKEELDFLKEYSKKTKINIEYHLMCSDQKKYFLEVERLGAKNVVIHIDKLFFDRKNAFSKSGDYFNMLLDSFKYKFNIILCARLDLMEGYERDLHRILKEFLKAHSAMESLFGVKKEIKLQVMGINKIGVQGQGFDERSISVIGSVKKFFNSVEGDKNLSKKLKIQVDGAISDETEYKIKKAGGKSVVVGSYLMKSLVSGKAKDIKEFVKKYEILKSL